MTDLLNVATIGAIEGQDCTALLTDAIRQGAPGLYFPAGDWVLNDLDLNAGDRARITVLGAGPAATRITTSVKDAGVFHYTATVERESFLEIGSMQLVNGPCDAAGGLGGLAIRISGPIGGMIGKGKYHDLWIKNFWAGVCIERHNNATITDVIAEYCSAVLYAVDSGDMEAARVKAQNGSGWAIEIHGTPDGIASHRAEGARLIGCSANTQLAGLLIDGFSFVHVSACSFSTCSAGALYMNDASECSITGGEWQSGPEITACRVTETCKRNRLIGLYAYDSLGGLDLAGVNHTVIGLHADGNLGLDLALRASGSVISGGQLLSTGEAASLVETGAGGNQIRGVAHARAVQITGASSQS